MRVERVLGYMGDQNNASHNTTSAQRLKRLFLPINASLEKQIRDIKARLYPSQPQSQHSSRPSKADSEVEMTLKERIAEQSMTIKSLKNQNSQAESRTSRLQSELDEKRVKLNDLVEEFVAKDEATARDYEARIRRLKTEHQQAISLLKREHDREISERNRTNIEYVDKLCKTHFMEHEAILKRARESEDLKSTLESKVEELQRQLRIAKLDSQRVADLRNEAQLAAAEIAALKDELGTLRLERYNRSDHTADITTDGSQRSLYAQELDSKRICDLQKGIEEMELDRNVEKALRIERAKKNSQRLMGQIQNTDLLKTPENSYKHTTTCHTKDLLASPIMSTSKSLSRPSSFSHLASPIADPSVYRETIVRDDSDATIHHLSPVASSPSSNIDDCDDTTQFVIQYPRIS